MDCYWAGSPAGPPLQAPKHSWLQHDSALGSTAALSIYTTDHNLQAKIVLTQSFRGDILFFT